MCTQCSSLSLSLGFLLKSWLWASCCWLQQQEYSRVVWRINKKVIHEQHDNLRCRSKLLPIILCRRDSTTTFPHYPFLGNLVRVGFVWSDALGNFGSVNLQTCTKIILYGNKVHCEHFSYFRGFSPPPGRIHYRTFFSSGLKTCQLWTKKFSPLD